MKKTSFKLSSVAFAAIATVALTAGCSSSSTSEQSNQSDDGAVEAVADCAGTWELNGIIENGEETDPEGIAQLKDLGMVFSLEMTESGDMDLTIMSETVTGTWSADGASTCVIEAEGETTNTTLNGDLLTIEEEGVEVIFKRA